MNEYQTGLQNQPPDVSAEFLRQENHFFVGRRAEGFDAGTGTGEVRWEGRALKQRVSYHQISLQFEDYRVWEGVPPGEYEDDRAFPFSVSFVSDRTARLRVAARPEPEQEPSLMLDGGCPALEPWETTDAGGAVTYAGPHGSVVVERDPWRVSLLGASGDVLTRTMGLGDAKGVTNALPTPFCFVRDPANLHRLMAASFSLSPGEKLFGGGESFTRLDKRGQKMVLWTYDAYGAQTPEMYKPVPFFLSSLGYGMFAHTSAPLTLDLGHSHDGAATVFLGDDFLDLFLFFGNPKEIVSEYTKLTGRAKEPPLWSFGLWMGRETYSSEDEVRDVARGMREHRVPCDAVHIDVGWTEKPYHNDFRFSPSRFPDPEAMISDLKDEGLRLSLWQFPYLHPEDALRAEAVEKGYVVLSANGKPPVDDAVIDLSNPEAEAWYRGKLAGLLKMGVGSITADFGEAAPLTGVYESRGSGLREHNLYPLRYNAAVAGITEEVRGESIMWARSAWAGSQRYPLHWSGDPENSDTAMAATLRAGLSLGLCGFSFWGHFIGGFAGPPPPDLYLRWLAFGAFCSHMRCHGAPPREPWLFGEEFTDGFRRIVEARYKLMPYVYAQAVLAAREGRPMIRPLFFEFPDDHACWLIEDEYLFGTDLLVAPLFGPSRTRDVYVPPGLWTEYWSGQTHEGGDWRTLSAGEVPIVVLVREGAAVPHAALAQSTDGIDWREIELKVYAAGSEGAEGLVCLPGDGELRRPRLVRDGGGFAVEEDPMEGRVRWTVSAGP